MVMARYSLLALAVAAAAAAPPPAFNSYVTLQSVKDAGRRFRHCDYVASFCAFEEGNEDFVFKVVPARNGAALPALSLQSSNLSVD